MTDLANLQIRVESVEAALAQKRLDGLAKSGANAEGATGKLTSAFLRFAGPAALVAGSVAALTKLTNTTREFDVLNAQLVTATGSAQGASVAFEAIQDFASNTPYDLAQVTESFTKLVNLGLTPSERALTSYGNTASAMGKDLNQLIEAVADAATGEFERLKEFGIKASSEGDKVSFTFRGVKTTVGKNAKEIEQYLQALGENEFAGAMAARMDTLDGALSNLADEWDKLWLTISEQGVGDAIEAGVRLAIDALTELTDMIKSGQLQAEFEAIGGKFEGVAEDFVDTLDIMSRYWNEFLGTSEGQGLAGATTETVSFIGDAFKNMPENLRAAVQLLVVELASLVNYGLAYGQAFGEVLGIEFAKIVQKAGAYGTAIGQALNPFGDDSFDLESELKRLDMVAAEMSDAAFARADKEAELYAQVRRDSITDIMAERDAAIDSYDQRIAKSDELRKKYDEEKAARLRANEGKDRLALFGQGADDTVDNGPTKEEQKKIDASKKDFDRLEKSLRTEEEVIAESYEKRMQIILDNTEEASIQRDELIKKLNDQYRSSLLGDLDEPDTYQEQLDKLNDFYIARLEMVRNNTTMEAEERLALEEELTTQRNERLAALEAQRTMGILEDNAALFGGLADLAKGYAGEQSSAYKKLFAVSKAFSIAQAAMSIATGLAKAQELGFPANIAEMVRVAATGASIVGQIQGSNFAGAFDSGGHIPAGKVGLVGEYGPEFVSGPANVTSRKETAAMARDAMSGGGAAPQVTIQNIVAPSMVLEALNTPDGEDVVKNIMQRNRNLM